MRAKIALHLNFAYHIQPHTNRSDETADFKFPGGQPVALRRADLADLCNPSTSPSTTSQSTTSQSSGVSRSGLSESRADRQPSGNRPCLYGKVMPEAALRHIRVKWVLPPARYYATWKSDGERYLLLFTRLDYRHRVQVLVGRTGDMWLVCLDVPDAFYNGVLLDGELLPDNRVFEAFGALLTEGNPCRHLSFRDRYTVLGHLVEEIRQGKMTGPGTDTKVPTQTPSQTGSMHTSPPDHPPFLVKLKEFVPVSQLASFARRHNLTLLGALFQLDPEGRQMFLTSESMIAPTSAPISTSASGGSTDGIILYPDAAPLMPFLDRAIKKFKPWQTLDFYWTTSPPPDTVPVSGTDKVEETKGDGTSEASTKLYLFVANGRQAQLFTVQDIRQTFEAFRVAIQQAAPREGQRTRWQVLPVSAIPKLESQIVECGYCPDDRIWKPLLVRGDKKWPNSIVVAEDTLEVLRERVSLQDICRAAKGLQHDGKTSSDAE